MTSVIVRSEPLTYERHHTETSFFADLIFRTAPGAEERLQRHREEMEIAGSERRARARRALRDGQFEYRVEPNRTDGQGGYFAPPLWLNELFATAPRTGRVLASLIPNKFALPPGVSSVNLPILTTGTEVEPSIDTAPVADRDIVDAPGSSTVVTLSGQVDASLQMLEQSPTGAAFDWAVFKDMSDEYDTKLEIQLLSGLGSGSSQILGVTNVANVVGITYTDASPSGTAMFPYFGKAAAQIGDGRKKPPECVLMRTARYSWLATQEDAQSRPLVTPDPIPGVASLLGWPIHLDDALPATLGAGANQDEVIWLRPSDLILLEGTPQTTVMREPLSGSLGVRLQMHNSVAAITNRYASGIATMTGSGFVVPSGE